MDRVVSHLHGPRRYVSPLIVTREYSIRELLPWDTKYTLCSGRIGAAYYDPTTARVLVLDDSEESVHYELCKTSTLVLSLGIAMRYTIDTRYSGGASTTRHRSRELKGR